MGKDYGRQGISPDNGQYSDEESGGYHGSIHLQDDSARELERLLPIANVGRIMKRALPANAKISKEAKETVQECVSEFISFITGEASDKCQKEKRKTVNGDDLLWAINTLGFEDYIEPLKVYLGRYREMEVEKSSMAWQGDQVVAKEGSSLGVSSADYGVRGSLAGGAGAGSNGTLWQIYGQKPPALMYSQHQLPTTSKVLYSRGSGMNGTHLQ